MSRYSIWVLEYADCPECPVSGLIWGAHNQGTVRMPYGYVVIKGGGHIIMVDVGFNYQDYGETFGQAVPRWPLAQPNGGIG